MPLGTTHNRKEMENLVSSGLYGKGLIKIDQPFLVERYNACMYDIGLAPTSLQEFHIDGFGWSPEIAEEKGDHYYLSHNGVANPYAIILTPKQENKPVFFPFHSFDRDIMRIVFATYRKHIIDITTESGIWIDIDQEMTEYLSPQDFLMVDSIMLRFYTPSRLMTAARKQRELVRTFYDGNRSWDNRALLEKIVSSAKKDGDLRFRNLDIPDTPYSHTQTFYTRAFGGLFILRMPGKSKPFLVHEEENLTIEGEVDIGHTEFWIGDESLMNALLNKGFLVIDENYFVKNPAHLERIRTHYFINALAQIAPDLHDDIADPRFQKRYVARLQREGLLNKAYTDIEKIMRMHKRGSRVATDDPLRWVMLFARPNPKLPQIDQEVLYKLMVKLFPADIYWLYYYDKKSFYKAYENWPLVKKNWVIKHIVNEIKNYK